MRPLVVPADLAQRAYEHLWLKGGEVYNAAVGAEVAQLVERNLAKVEVAGSNPVFRSSRS